MTAADQTVADNQSVALSSIFSVTGSGITQYQVFFGYPEGGSPALGTVTQDGTPIALDRPVTVSSLSGLAYTGSDVQGTDKIWIKAYNGTWTGWIEADMLDTGAASQAGQIPLLNQYLATSFVPPAPGDTTATSSLGASSLDDLSGSTPSLATSFGSHSS